MCGVIGYKPGPETDWKEQHDAFARLMRESKIRGMHAYGLATPTVLLRSHDVDEVIDAFDGAEPTIAHCRYSTSGDWQKPENNQPIVVGGLRLAFNGVIDMGTREEMIARWDVPLDSDNDGEIFLRRILAGQSDRAFVSSIDGSFAGVWLRGSRLEYGRNERRPLWTCTHHGAFWLASTRDVFARASFDLSDAEEVRPWT